jgi:hypothetical protein
MWQMLIWGKLAEAWPRPRNTPFFAKNQPMQPQC